MTNPALNYDDRHIALLEALWGDGYLSPGGAEEVARVIEGLHVRGARVLDIGSGSGAIAIALVQDHGAAHVTGVDVEGPVCRAARKRVTAAGVSTVVTWLRDIFDPVQYPWFRDEFIHPNDLGDMRTNEFDVSFGQNFRAANPA